MSPDAFEAAEANGETICGSALEWRKAFDHVRLSLLRKMLARAGVPAWLLQPLLAAYTSPRRLRVDGALGQRELRHLGNARIIVSARARGRTSEHTGAKPEKWFFMETETSTGLQAWLKARTARALNHRKRIFTEARLRTLHFLL